jgi:small-conductance mechanosensitive channel
MFIMLLLPASGNAAAAASVNVPEVRDVHSSAPLKVYNRAVMVFRSPFLGATAAERAERAEELLVRLLERGGKGVVSLQAVPQGYALQLDGVFVFFITPEDVDPLKQETLQQAAQSVVTALEQVVRENSEARDVSVMLHAVGLATAASLLLLFAGWLLHRGRLLIASRLTRLAHSYSEKFSVGGESLIHRDKVFSLVGYGISLVYWLILAVVIFEWLGFVLGQFPYTRPWGEQMDRYLVNGAGDIGSTVARSVPGLVVALLIFLFARLVTNLLKSVFDRVEQGRFEIAGLDRDTVRPTRRLIAAAVWLFAVAMAYPYLPGAQTAAFKGLTVLVGLMVSLGGSSLVGQAASGLILMYTRTLRPGEYVKIAANEGTVMELGMFTTRIRTGLGDELTLPNSLVLANVTRNYSRTVHGPGFILDATVTIGYDTPWRQVHAMLVEAARRTPGVLELPLPQVFQVALSDFYPEYRLVCQAIPAEPRSRAEVMNSLHANIQDVFNEYGVQIMSPHYRSDPEHPKWVPKDKWAPAPARPEGITGSDLRV